MVKATRRIKANNGTGKIPAARATRKTGTTRAEEKTAATAKKTRTPTRGAEAKVSGANAAAVPKNTAYRPKESYTPAEAKKWLLDICSDITRDGNKRAYVEDRSGDLVVTLDPIKRNLRHPVLDVSIQKFKDQFAAYCTLVRIGLCFRLTRRGGAQHVYARSHTAYRYPLKEVVDHWLDGIVDQKVGQVAEAGERLTDRDAQRDRQLARLDIDVEDLKETHQQLRKGVQRASLKLPPFIEDPTRPHAVPLGTGRGNNGDEADTGQF